MPSDTQKTWKRRLRRKAKAGRAAKRVRAKGTTPKFPIHPEPAQPPQG